MIRLRLLVPLLALSVSACALPPLPALPKLPRILPTLPKLPALPKLSQVADVLPVGSKGESMQQAAQRALPAATAWDAAAAVVMAQGTRLDPGGRNGGHDDGVWIFKLRAPEQARALELRVADEQVASRVLTLVPGEEATLGAELAALVDSPTAMAKSGLGGRSFTMVLRAAADGPRYVVIEETSSARVELDARSGERVGDAPQQ